MLSDWEFRQRHVTSRRHVFFPIQRISHPWSWFVDAEIQRHPRGSVSYVRRGKDRNSRGSKVDSEENGWGTVYPKFPHQKKWRITRTHVSTPLFGVNGNVMFSFWHFCKHHSVGNWRWKIPSELSLVKQVWTNDLDFGRLPICNVVDFMKKATQRSARVSNGYGKVERKFVHFVRRPIIGRRNCEYRRFCWGVCFNATHNSRYCPFSWVNEPSCNNH